jgi:SpoVK/Ycf46/Vps4 family AAA+-type ATPase
MKKQQKYFFQKYQKKYFFFQKSFFDFLYWRSTKNLDHYTTINNEFHSDKNIYPYEFEKMNFYDYWKKPEIQKIESCFQNSKKEFKQNSNMLSTLPPSKLGSTPLCSTFNAHKATLRQMQIGGNSAFGKDKNKRRVSTFKKSSNFSTNQKLHFFFLKKRKDKVFHQREKKRNNENFLSKKSSFEIFQSLNFLNPKKIGEFFPRKKNFVQYWIFPFLGVLFFFSRNNSVGFFHKNRKLQHFFSVTPFQIQNITNTSSSFQHETQKNFFLSKIYKENQIQSFEFSFPLKISKEVNFFHNLEKTEYEEFFQFYNQLLKDTISFSETPFAKHLISQKKSLRFFASPSDFMEGQKGEFFFQTAEKFQKKLQRKRNSLSWKWFTFHSNSINPKTFFATSSLFQMPQKAKFFLLSSENMFPKYLSLYHEMNFSNLENFQEKTSTPLFDYSKSLFLVDEQKRNLSILSEKENLSIKNTKKNFPYFLKTLEIQKFLKKNSFLLKYKNFAFSESFILKEKNQTKKNFYFLDKWAKTQKFSLLENSILFQNKNFSPFLDSFRSFSKEEKKIQFKKQTYLDLLFFQKFFKKIKFQNFEKKFQFQKVLKKGKKHKKFSQFKKSSFEFFAFQHSKKNYKKFYNFLCSKTKEKQQVNSLISLPLGIEEAKKSRELSLLQSKIAKNEKTSIFTLTHPILFQFSQNTKNFQKFKIQKISTLFEKPVQNEQKLEFQTSFNIFPQSFYAQNFYFSFFSHPDKKENFQFLEHNKSQPSFFSFSVQKFSFLDKFKNKLFDKNCKNFFFNFVKIENFQKSFLFEASERKNPLLFKKNIYTIFSFEVEKEQTFVQKQENFQEERNQHKHFFKQSLFRQFEFKKKKLAIFQLKKQNKGIHLKFSGSSLCGPKKHRKFEKIFRAFFSPFKNTKNSFLFQHSDSNATTSTSLSLGKDFRKKQIQKIQRGTKTKKDVLFLQSLSVFLKKNAEQTLFFIPTNKKNRKQNANKKEYDKICENFHKPLHPHNGTIRFSPAFVFKRNGFLFSPFPEKKENKKNNSFQRFEKEKIFQKKRRLKKEKLETRRRKKRKRFFPRPLWLRMNLYKKFLKNRHSQKFFSVQFEKKKKNLKNLHFSSNFFQNNEGFPKMVQKLKTFHPVQVHDPKKRKQLAFWITEQKKEQKQLIQYFHERYQQKENISKKTSDFQVYDIDSVFFKKQNLTFQKKILKKNFQRDNWSEKKIVPRKNLNLGITGAVQTENFFSLSPSKNSPNIGFLEGEKISKNIGHFQISNEIFQEFLRFSWKSSWFQNNLKTYTQTIEKNFEKMQSNESHKTFPNLFDFWKRKNFLFFFHGVPNFLEQSQNDFLLRKSVFQKFTWYSNIQNSFSLQPHQFTRQKENSEFFGTEKRRNISEYNQILYLRISEILKKFKFSENMANESFFQIFKGNRRQNEKIFSGTQIAGAPTTRAPRNVSFFTKTALFFEKFQIPSQPVIPAFSLFSSLFNDFSIKPTGEMPTLRALWAFQKTNCSHFQNQNALQNFWAFKKRKDTLHSFKGTKHVMNFLRKASGFEKFKAPEKVSTERLFFQTSEKEKNNHFIDKAYGFNRVQIFSEQKSNLDLLDTMTLKKFQTFEKKSSLFGVQSLKQNSKISYRYFKFHISSFLQNEKRGPLLFPKLLKNQNKQNSAKSSLNFWWAQRPFQNFDFLGTSQFQNFSELTVQKQNEMLFLSNISFLVFGVFFFHFAVFYTLFKIPEIRSLFKFTLLLFSKFLKSFFQVFFSIYNIFQEYTQNGLNLFKNSSSFPRNIKTQRKKKTEKKKLDFSAQFPKMFFSLKKCQIEINFYTHFFDSLNQNSQAFQSENLIFSTPKKTKFDVFAFEFFPRFFSLSPNAQIEIASNFGKVKHSLKFSEKQKTLFSQVSQNKAPMQKVKLIRSVVNKKGKTLFYSTKTEKNLSQFALCFLVFGKNILFVPYSLFKIVSTLSTKVFEIFENIFYAFYKFLEKPAEFMIEFIAFVFLIEWSSDILGFLPDSIETSFWKSSQKLLRPVRSGIFFLSFGIFFQSPSSKSFLNGSQLLFKTGQNVSFLNPFHFLISTGFFQFSNFATYVLQKRLFSMFEKLPSILLQPDIDIFVRQRKGILFWDIWAEILRRAAEKYNVNLPSFVTLKEEQEIFIDKLVQDSQFFENTNFFSGGYFFQSGKWSRRSLQQNLEVENFHSHSGKSFSSFLQNFLIQNRPSSFFDFSFSSSPQYYVIQSQKNSLFFKTKNNEKLRQFFLSNLFDFRKEKNMGKIQSFINSSDMFLKPVFEKESSKNKFLNFFPFFENLQSFDTFEQIFTCCGKEKNVNSVQNSLFLSQKIDRWESSQYSTFQSQETDFFLDIYPPKSLKHVHFLKYYEPVHSTLGPLICQIYAGLFPKQISKNILVVGESGTAKTFFLRALAGETEMKIITENASRYAVVQRGVAVGMKYLRDVFDAIALQTPCFFVMEDLHVIGSKRPFLISENEKSQTVQFSFGLEQQEVHETNQMIYQSTRHSISDFRRPYKGDFSIGIPTNSFLQAFYSRVAKRDQSSFFYSLRKGHKFQNSQFFGGNFSSNIWNSLSSPLPIDSLETALQNKSLQEKESSSLLQSKAVTVSGLLGRASRQNDGLFGQKFTKIQSSLQFSKEQVFAPPATSPFTVLLMKEQKKFKPKKIVQESSWGGLSADQILLYEKENSSIRAKIAVLAEKTMNLSRGKFDMITDLLVIIDNVRANRGFVVFGTTHKPSSLDPALRRPGRFDETLSFAQNPNFLSRFEILKMNLENSVSTLNFFDSSILTENFSETDLFNILSQTKLSFFHNYKFALQKSKGSLLPQQNIYHIDMHQSYLPVFEKNQKRIVKKQLYSQISPTKAFGIILKSPVFEDFYSFIWKKQKRLGTYFIYSCEAEKGTENKKHETREKQTLNFSLRNPSIFSNQRYTLLPNGPSHLLNLTYSKLGIFVAESNLLNDPTSFIPFTLDIEKNFSKYSNFMHFSKKIFYDSWSGTKKQRNFQLQVFLSGKVAEFLISSCTQHPFIQSSDGTLFQYQSKSQIQQKDFFTFFFPQNFKLSPLPFGEGQKCFSSHSGFFFTKLGFFENSYQKSEKFVSSMLKNSSALGGNSMPTKNAFENFFLTKIHFSKKENCCVFSKEIFQGEKNFYWTVFGNDESWRGATPFLFSLIQKRFLFTKNLLLSKMLFFENMDQRRKPPNPPGSSILIPSKKYENFKRTEVDFFQKAHFSIHEKLQIHQKQRFLKQLYNIPVQKYFRSEFRKNQKTLFSSSFKEFAYLDAFVQKSSSSSSYYKKYIQVRHRFSNVNQWWNGMFPEQTRETTYLSDVDWRTMFVSSSESQVTISKKTKQQGGLIKNTKVLKKSSPDTVEFLMDFPDAEQYYNPRNRKWFFNLKSNCETKLQFSKNTTFWAIFEKDLQYEIFSHFLMESFYQSFSNFEKKREMLDFFAFSLLSKGFLKEFDFLTTYSRF